MEETLERERVALKLAEGIVIYADWKTPLVVAERWRSFRNWSSTSICS
jgi:hypothetical protein